MSHSRSNIFVFVCVVVWFPWAAAALGQTSPRKQYTDEELTSLLQQRLKEVDGIRELDEPRKAKVRESYQQALREMEAAKTWAARSAYSQQLVTAAPTELQQAKAILATQPTQPALSIPDNLEQAISKQEAELERQRSALADLEAEPKRRAARRVEIPKLTTAAREKLSEANAELQTPAAGDDSTPSRAARRMFLVARRRNIQQEILSYDNELAACEALAELLPLRRDLAARRVALAEQVVKQFQEMANQRRRQQAEQQVQQASWEAGQAPPALKRLADEKTQLAEMRKTLAQRITETTQQLDQTKQDRDAWKRRFDGLRDKERTVGLSNASGLLLRKECETLPNLRAHHEIINALQRNINECQWSLLQLHDQRSQFYDLDRKTAEILANLNWAHEQNRRGELEAAVREALQTKRQYLDDLTADYYAYLDKLSDLDNVERQLIKQTEAYAGYINERVLWIASNMAIGVVDVRNAGGALLWLAGPEACLDVARTLTADAVRNPAVPGLAMCLFLSLFYWQLRFRTRMRQIGEKVARGSCYRFLPTLEASILTLMASVVWPGVSCYVGWRLSVATDASELCKAVGAGLMAAAQMRLALEFLRQTCCKQGLAEAHFGWPGSAVKSLRQNLRWLGLSLPPAVFVVVAMGSNVRWDDSLGRISFIAVLLLAAIFLQRILRLKGGVAQALLAERRGGLLARFRYVWYFLGVLTPPALAVMAAMGYYYTAQQLANRLVTTAYVLVGVLLLRSLLLRWIVVNQRRLAIEQARQRRTAAQTETPLGEESSGQAAATPERDLATISIQTRRLVGCSLTLVVLLGIWGTWVDVLPAFRVLNQVEVWNTGSTSDVVAAADSANAQTTAQAATIPAAKDAASVESQASRSQNRRRAEGMITLGDLVLAVLVLATTFIAAKNIPGLLEMAVLQHLPVDAGARYALSTVSRYLTMIAGVMLACWFVGLGWSKVQWLVTAICLGLGFGLQEIFANFISGLIILFERPVRVGDVVTIDTVTGVVSRIRLRTTTVTDGDRKELIIPNKEFITGRVLNWTLSDPVNRVVINVGIAYGSDTQRAAQILQKLAQEHPNVLDDPPPRVTLESFGDSALNFVLRFFLPNLENRGTVIHEMHMAIDRAFREAGIEMPFPQQDVHVRSIDASFPLGLPLASGESGPRLSIAGETPRKQGAVRQVA